MGTVNATARGAAMTDAKAPPECIFFDARSDAHRADPMRIELLCPVAGCGARCRAHIMRVSALEASSVLAPPGWVLMFRQHFFGALVGGLCPKHAKIWDDPVEEGSADD